MNLEYIINPIVNFYLFIYLNLFNGPISNSDYMASDWIIVSNELERLLKNMS